MTERIATRLYIPEPIGAAAIELNASQAHKLRHVLRLGSGAAIGAFNESSGEWLCHLSEIGRGRAVLNPVRQIRPPEIENDLWLVFAPLKRVRLDWLVEKAT